MLARPGHGAAAANKNTLHQKSGVIPRTRCTSAAKLASATRGYGGHTFELCRFARTNVNCRAQVDSMRFQEFRESPEHYSGLLNGK